MSQGYRNFTDEAGDNTYQYNVATKADEYDPYAIPPNIEICENHLLATNVGVENTSRPELCGCCAKRISKTPIGLCDSTNKLSYLGPGYTLFFLFMKCCCIIMAFIFLVFGIYALNSNSNGSACTDATLSAYCSSTYATLLSFWNSALLDEKNAQSQQTICLFVVICLVILMQVMRYYIRKTSIECDERDTSASDYTLMVQNIPRNLEINYSAELKKIFESAVLPDSSRVVVERINLAYDIRQLTELQKKLQTAVAKKSKAFEYINKNGSFPEGYSEEAIKSEITNCKNEIKAYTNSFQNENRNLFAGVAFISFRTEKMKKDLLSTYKISRFTRFKIAFREIFGRTQTNGLFFNKNVLILKEAAEPGDIFWNNLGISDREKYIRDAVSYFLSLLLIAGCTALIYYFTIKEEEMSNSSDTSTSVTFLTYLLSFLIVVINKGLSGIMPLIVSFEKNFTISDNYSRVVRKLTLVLFLNSGLISFFVDTFYDELNYATSSGLISTVLNVIIMNSILYTLMNLINPGYLACLYKRYKYRKNAKSWTVTQEAANAAWENPLFNIDTVSSNMMNVFQITAFFAPLIPLGLIFSLFFFFANYWIYKHALLRRSTIKNELGNDLAENMTGMIDLCIVFFSVGVFVFNYLLSTPSYNGTTILILVIGIIHWLLPTQKINKIMFKIEEKYEEKEYKDASPHFDTDYSLMNPVTQLEMKEEKIKRSRIPRNVY